MDETEAIRRAEGRYLQGAPVPDGRFLVTTCERIKDLVSAAPEIVSRPVTVVEWGVDDLFELTPHVILDFGGLCLILCDEWEEWHMGQWDDANTIACWARYGSDLEHAIKCL